MTFYEVLNPAMRMSWIQKHWDRDFADGAEAAIKQLVCLFCTSIYN
jgi:hypothetical protein